MKETKIVANQDSASMTLYEANQQMYSQVPKASPTVINGAFASIGAWFSTHYKDSYFCLMCREKMDITFFHFDHNMNYEKGKKEIKSLLESRGEIWDIQYDHNNDTYQCWVKDENGMFHMYLLFDGQFMIVEV